MPIWMWLAASGVLLVVEILTVDLLFASLAFSALLAAGANALGFNVVIQGVVFGLGGVGFRIPSCGSRRHISRCVGADPCGITTHAPSQHRGPITTHTTRCHINRGF